MCEKQIYNARYRELVQHLRRRREGLGLTQAQVAARLGLRRTWLSKIELGELRLDLVGLRNLCSVYGLRMRDVVRLMEE